MAEAQAPRTLDASDSEPDVEVRRPRSRGSAEAIEEDQVAEEAERLRARRNLLQQEVEIETLEEQLDTLRRRRRAGVTPAGSFITDDEDVASSVGGASSTHAPRRSLANRPRLKEPEPFKGKTLKEAREFIRSLELVFALAPDAYPEDSEKVLYGVMFLAGEAREQWHHENNLDQRDSYTWNAFKTFVVDAVEDPANRALTVTLSYENAKQGEAQSAQSFGAELATLEEQMDAYTPAQRTRHLLAKLRPQLRTAIVTYHDIPHRREDLISLATRLESAGKRDVTGSHASTKRVAAERKDFGGRSSSKKRRTSPPPQKNSDRKRNKFTQASSAQKPLEEVECWGCGEKGHYKTKCPRLDSGEKTSNRKITAGDAQAKLAKASQA